MTEFRLEELKEAHRSLASTLQKCEKVALSPRLGQSQRTINARRIAGLRVALALIEQELSQYTGGSEATQPA